MKKSISISLAVLILLLSAKDLLVLASFQLFQNEIADQWCINKYEPELMCYGQCFLDQQLAENYSTSGKSAHFLNTRLNTSLFYYNDAVPLAPLSTKRRESKRLNYFHLDLQNDLFTHQIFHPPEPKDFYVGDKAFPVSTLII